MDIDEADVKELGNDSSSSGEDYDKLKALERQLEFITIQEEYLKDEMRNLNR